MSISYKLISQKPIIFNRLVGMKMKDFESILEKLTPLWQKRFWQPKSGQDAALNWNLPIC